MTELTDSEIEAIHDAAREAAENAWIGNIPDNPYPNDPRRADIWASAFGNAFTENNH